MRVKIVNSIEEQLDVDAEKLILEAADRVHYSARYRFEFTRPHGNREDTSIWIDLARAAALTLAEQRAKLDLARQNKIVSKVTMSYGDNSGDRKRVIVVVESIDEVSNGQSPR